PLPAADFPVFVRPAPLPVAAPPRDAVPEAALRPVLLRALPRRPEPDPSAVAALPSLTHRPSRYTARQPVALPFSSDCTYCIFSLREYRTTVGRPSGSVSGASSR